MESIRYRDTRVDNETVERLRQRMKETPEHGVALFNGYRKYANLQGWRNQQLHEYLGVRVEIYGNYLLCSCGLEALETEIESYALPISDLPKEIAALNLSELIRVHHHVDFSDTPKLITALIVSTTFDWTLNTYLWAAYCQTCFALVVNAEHEDAIMFIDSHNSGHMSSC